MSKNEIVRWTEFGAFFFLLLFYIGYYQPLLKMRNVK